MTDTDQARADDELVARLRFRAKQKAMRGEGSQNHEELTEWRAADEITRLRAELAAAKADVAAMNGLYLDAAEKQRKAEAELAAAVQRAEAAERERDECMEYGIKQDRVIASQHETLAAERAARERIEKVLNWLDGTSPDHEGNHFSAARDKWGDDRPPFWWRTHAHKMFAALAAPAEASAEEATARDAALEEAAKVADECSYSGTGLWIADNIRALKSPARPTQKEMPGRPIIYDERGDWAEIDPPSRPAQKDSD